MAPLSTVNPYRGYNPNEYSKLSEVATRDSCSTMHAALAKYVSRRKVAAPQVVTPP